MLLLLINYDQITQILETVNVVKTVLAVATCKLIIIIIIYSPKCKYSVHVHKNSRKHSCSGKTYQAHNSAYDSLN